MTWNEPDKNKKDSWDGKETPPDLDEALKKLQDKIKKTFGGRGAGGGAGGTAPKGTNALLAGIVFLVAFVIWGLSGIFIVDPAEQAVVLRFGKFVETVGPGPHWIPRLIERKITRNVTALSDFSYSSQMLTKDENIVSVSLAVQYRIGDLGAYLFNVSDPQESLEQATASALRQVVGHTTLDQIITEGREVWGNNVEDLLKKILDTYKVGITISSVSPQPARAPDKVQDAFDDAIKAQEDEKRFKEKAFAYQASVEPIAAGNAKRIFAEAKAYAEKVVLMAKGETAEFLAILPEYLKAPFVISERMYLDSLEQVFANTSKVLVDGKAGNMFYLPLDKLLANTSVQAPAPPNNNLKLPANSSNFGDVSVTTRPKSTQNYRGRRTY